MAPGNSKEKRLTRLGADLADSEMEMVDFSGTEYVNEINLFTVRVLTKDTIDLDEFLGTEMEPEVEVSPGTRRQFPGIITGARFAGLEQVGYVYEFQLRPWLWLLGYRVNSRIFHEMTVQDIIRQICNETLGRGGDIDMPTSHGTRLREYVVQYNESDLDFIRRLMEEEGINFHFALSAGRQRLVLTDGPADFKDAAVPDVSFNASDRATIVAGQTFQAFSDQRKITSGQFKTSDYDFKNPKSSLEVTVSKTRGYDSSEFEVYRYPGDYVTEGEGKALANRRMEAVRTSDSVVEAMGYAPGLAAGTLMTLSDAADSASNGSYAVLQAQHQFSSNSYRTGAGGGQAGGRGYSGRYILTKASNPVAPEMKTPRPRVLGPQTAVVTMGPEGNSDPHSRIKVRFHWDISAESMYCRVAHLWAGNAWGAVFIPRVGMEVVVEFLHGDINQPIITGCVYNGANPPPWQLPGDHTVSGIKTTTMGGSGFNELSFDDKAGEEKVNIHAQKDYISTIENDSTKKIGGNFKTEITGTRTVNVTQASKLTSNDSVRIEATNKIELVVGTSKLVLTQQGATLDGISIKLSATGDLKTTGLVSEHSASGSLAISAPIVRINS
jgi:type VI secretion system secreted protein VgrG